MPALYAHNRFGQKVLEQLKGELKDIVTAHDTQFKIGLQGPDIFFFYKAYSKNDVTRYGSHLHEISAYPFFKRALKIIKERGRNSREYAYLLGFICHFVLDSECHPYVSEMIEKTGIGHVEIEGEFEKKLLRMDQKDPLAYPLSKLVPTDTATALAIAPFFEGKDWVTVKKSLRWMKRIEKLITAPGPIKYNLIEGILKTAGKYPDYKGMMRQHKDNEKCLESNIGLLKRFDKAVSVAVWIIESFDESLQKGKVLDERFDRTFE